jgi:hypothetical protein
MYLYTLVEQAPSNFSCLNHIDHQLVEGQMTRRGNIQGWFWNVLKVTFKKRLQDEDNEV